ncbi:MAG: S1C family serine protease [Acholeplasmataceae bacterium]
MKKKLFGLLMILALVVTLAGCFDLRAQLPYQSPHEYENIRLNMIADVERSVVAVITETGHGSGIIYKRELIDEETSTYLYYIMTNHHVVEDGGEMRVHFGESQDDIKVKDVASASLYDIAVVRIETTRNLRVHKSAAIDDNVRVEIIKGQDVYAIGTPQDIKKFNYVTDGIVSLPEFMYNGVSGLSVMHNAELNPGNSGGPLFNLKGELIGINVAKVAVIPTSTGTISAEGLNYSLNINKIAPIVRGFIESDYEIVVRRPRLGITVQEVEMFLDPAQGNDPSLLPENPVGVVVIGLDETRDAYGKIQIHDLIIRMNGDAITSIADIAAQLADADFGDTHEVTVLRKVNDVFVEVTVTITLS